MAVFFYSTGGSRSLAGGVRLTFSSTLEYHLRFCSSSYSNLPVTPPSSVNKIWKFSLIRSSDVRVKITCNGVEVLNLLITETTCFDRYWSNIWNKDVEKIKFHSRDKASDEYRAGK